MNLPIEQIQELAKSYFAYKVVGSSQADAVLKTLNQLRINLVSEAEMRRVFWDEVDIKKLASGARRNVFYSRNDVDYLLKRGIVNLESDVTVSLEKRSGTVKRFTRESTAWQALFSERQQLATFAGVQVLQDFPQELRFGANESLNIGITGQKLVDGKIWLHGATMENNFDLNLQALQEEIASSIPQTEIIPLRFRWLEDKTEAVDVNGNKQILSDKATRSVLITHVSAQTYGGDDQAGYIGWKLSLYDEAKNQQFCDKVNILGIAGEMSNPYQNWYELPYPHVLYRGSRLKMRGYLDTPFEGDSNLVNLVFKGITI